MSGPTQPVRRGTAALVSSVLFGFIMMGSLELGNFYLSEHALRKAVRDGARFAARQSFVNYTACTGTPGGTVEADTRAVVMRSTRIPFWNANTITVTHTCKTTAGTEAMKGIYKDFATGAPIVTVSATVPYTPVLASFGFRGIGLNLNAFEEAAVSGV